ncbi:adenosylmethionine decarboxylase [Desertihabitans brevis]|uniref:Adenosylmethionine decarboxylase n=1 Tax=Desertihabitans brevis TaxID=2268447 RepID=A0A367YUD9_9ACTN|nr:adenosylmethionine decarboxylase [Desertihabitans brevis]RCK68591.1 adenosylmethionine decarboxylase [Desertihabitans brevis]
MVPARNTVHLFEVGAADAARLDDLDGVRAVLAEVVEGAGLTPLGETSHRFQPQGLSIAVLLAESHIAVHTWPEQGTAYVTLTTCREPDADFTARTVALLRERFGAAAVDVRELR